MKEAPSALFLAFTQFQCFHRIHCLLKCHPVNSIFCVLVLLNLRHSHWPRPRPHPRTEKRVEKKSGCEVVKEILFNRSTTTLKLFPSHCVLVHVCPAAFLSKLHVTAGAAINFLTGVTLVVCFRTICACVIPCMLTHTVLVTDIQARSPTTAWILSCFFKCTVSSPMWVLPCSFRYTLW